jgi:hypothetical protein
VFTRDDEFRISTLQRILASHSGNPLDPDEARALCDELAMLEEKQQRFLMASVEQMQAAARSALNVNAYTSRWSFPAFFTSMKSVAERAVGAVSSAHSPPSHEPPSSSALGAGNGGALPPKLKARSDDNLSNSSGHIATPNAGASARTRDGGQDDIRNSHHQRVQSTGVSTLVRRTVAGANVGRGATTLAPGADPWVVVQTPPSLSPPTHSVPPGDPPPDFIADGTCAVEIDFEVRPLSLAGPALGSRIPGLIPRAYKDPPVSVGAPRVVLLLTAAMTLLFAACTPRDIFLDPAAVQSRLTDHGPAAIGNMQVQPRQFMFGGADHAWLHTVLQAAAAVWAFGTGAYVARPLAVIQRRERAVRMVKLAIAFPALALIALHGDVARTIYEGLADPQHAIVGVMSTVSAAVDVAAGSLAALLWLTAADLAVCFVARSMLRAMSAWTSQPTLATPSTAVTPTRAAALAL